MSALNALNCSLPHAELPSWCTFFACQEQLSTHESIELGCRAWSHKGASCAGAARTDALPWAHPMLAHSKQGRTGHDLALAAAGPTYPAAAHGLSLI